MEPLIDAFVYPFFSFANHVRTSGQAVTWFKLAAKERLEGGGVPEAMYNLGICYDNGFGVLQDDVLACTWYKKAAAGGIMEAQFNVAGHYARGKVRGSSGCVGGVGRPYFLLAHSFYMGAHATTTTSILEACASLEFVPS